MDHDEYALFLDDQGMGTDAIGPIAEWHPVPREQHQQRHALYWKIVAGLIKTEPGNYDDLPDYLTETASEQLENN